MKLKSRRAEDEILMGFIFIMVMIVMVIVTGIVFVETLPMGFASPHSGTVVTSTPYQSTELNLNGVPVSLSSYNVTIIYQGASLQTTIDCASYQSVGSHFPVLVWRYLFLFGTNLELGTLPSGCFTPQQGNGLNG